MAHARSNRLDQVRAGIAQMEREGYPSELVEMFLGVRAVFDNAERLVALFGVVDQASADEAWELYRAFAAQKQAARTLH